MYRRSYGNSKATVTYCTVRILLGGLEFRVSAVDTADMRRFEELGEGQGVAGTCQRRSYRAAELGI